MKSPLVSVVIPVYNAERYLNQCIDSIVGQDIGFVENIELILVNDGSVDSTDDICEKYARDYPNNVVYVKQKNAGASAARNAGIEAAGGQFISFVDADDYITKDAVGAVMKFFKNTPEDVDVAIIRVIQFGEKNRERPINKKFERGTRVADLTRSEWFDVCPRVAPSFIRASAAKRHRFHKGIRFYEDTRYINEVISGKMKLGVVDEGVYYNRKHDSNDTAASITTGATAEKRFYQDSPKMVSLYLLKKMAKQYDEVPVYFQHLVMYEMRWRMFYNPNTPQDILSAAEYKIYRGVNREILSLMSDEAILSFKLNHSWQRVYLLNLKHGTDILDEAAFGDDDRLVWRGKVIFNHMKKMQVRPTDLYLVNDTLVVKGYFVDLMIKGIEVHPRIDGEIHKDFDLLPNSVATAESLEDEFHKRIAFVLRMQDIDSKPQRVDFLITINNHQYVVKNLNIGELFDQEVMPVFTRLGGYIVAWKQDSFLVMTDTLGRRIIYRGVAVKRYLVKLVKKVGRRVICTLMTKTRKLS